MTQPSRRAMAEALRAAGFLDGLDAEERRELEEQLTRDAWVALTSHPWRGFICDDADVAAEGGAAFLEMVAPALERLGVEPLAGEDLFDEDSCEYRVALAGRTVLLLSAEEAEADDSGERRHQAWGLVPARLQALLNAHLEAAGLPDRFYSLYIGNDANVLLLTPGMLDAAVTHAPAFGARPRDLPYIRTERWPDFGYPGAME